MNAVRTNGGTWKGWEGHGSWEGWVYDPENGGYLDAPGGHYSIPLYRCKNAIDCADWLAHMTQKTWMNNSLLGGLVRAMQDVVGLRTEGHNA